MIDYKSRSARTLLEIASRRGEVDIVRCSLAFDHLATAARMRDCLHDALIRHRLSELQFATLVVLFDVAPEATPTAALAEQTGVSRSAMTDALDVLESHNFVSRVRDCCDRRIIHVWITVTGRAKIDQAMNDYLNAAAHAARFIVCRNCN